MQIKTNPRNLSMIFLSCMVMFISCVPYKKVKYFNDSEHFNEPKDNLRIQKKISSFDNLYIKVLSTDEKTAQIFNAGDELRSYAASNMISYTVDEKGNINFPFVGDINVTGLSLSEASRKIQKLLSEYMPNIAVVVKFIDNKVTVMGEVQRQGRYPFTEDKINVYEAISLAGGLSKYGDHKNIILIRHENDTELRYKLDLSTSEIIGSSTYYILPNDIIVVEPLKAVTWSYQNLTYSTILTTITTLIAVLYFAGFSK